MSPLAGYLGLVWPGPLVCASGIKIFSISGGHPAMLDITELPSCRAAELAAIVPFQSTSVTDFKETFVDNTNKCQIQWARGAARMPSPGGLRYKPFDACLRTTSTLRPPTHPPPALATTPSGPEPDPELTCGPKCRTADVNVISKRLCR